MKNKTIWFMMLLVIIIFPLEGCVSNTDRIKEVQAQLLEGKKKRKIKLFFDRSLIKEKEQVVTLFYPESGSKGYYRDCTFHVNRRVLKVMKIFFSNNFIEGSSDDYDLRVLVNIKDIHFSNAKHYCRKEYKEGPYWYFASVGVTTSIEFTCFDKDDGLVKS